MTEICYQSSYSLPGLSNRIVKVSVVVSDCVKKGWVCTSCVNSISIKNWFIFIILMMCREGITYHHLCVKLYF